MEFWIARTYSAQGIGKSFMGKLALKHQRFAAVIMGILKLSKFRDLISSGLLPQDVLGERQ